MRVQIHLNLAKPQLAETVVRIQSESGAWIGVAYATRLHLNNVVPVINSAAQHNIAKGSSKKTPHAFLEGDLIHFEGRLRNKAPETVKNKFQPPVCNDFETFKAAYATMDPINYNPRFADCFYKNEQQKSNITQEFVSCSDLIVVGWGFFAENAQYKPMQTHSYCHALDHTSLFEKIANQRGQKQTQELLHASFNNHMKHTP